MSVIDGHIISIATQSEESRGTLMHLGRCTIESQAAAYHRGPVREGLDSMQVVPSCLVWDQSDESSKHPARTELARKVMIRVVKNDLEVVAAGAPATSSLLPLLQK
jgi:hypothetical protein